MPEWGTKRKDPTEYMPDKFYMLLFCIPHQATKPDIFLLLYRWRNKVPLSYLSVITKWSQEWDSRSDAQDFAPGYLKRPSSDIWGWSFLIRRLLCALWYMVQCTWPLFLVMVTLLLVTHHNNQKCFQALWLVTWLAKSSHFKLTTLAFIALV